MKAEWYGDTAGNLSTAIKQPVNRTEWSIKEFFTFLIFSFPLTLDKRAIWSIL